MRKFPDEFLWGAATSAYQVEGGNVLSDWWRIERMPGAPLERSGDAVDHYHRYAEDMGLLAGAGLSAYRFSIEWARLEPDEGEFSRAELLHYRRMIDTALTLGLTPVVTLHHFTLPAWLAAQGGWRAPGSLDAFARYVAFVSEILVDVEWVCTINEPNIAALMAGAAEHAMGGEFDGTLPTPDLAFGEILAVAHARARTEVKARTQAKVGWTVAQQALVPVPGAEEKFAELSWAWEDFYLQTARGDDFIGTQSYTSQTVSEKGIVPHPAHPDNTLTGWAYRPDALGIAVRRAHEVTQGTPILVTENGIAIADDTRRIAYTRTALTHLADAIADGIDVRGYLHWSALDNYEWGHWGPTFGLIAVDRTTFERQPKPSLAWLGDVARTAGASLEVA